MEIINQMSLAPLSEIQFAPPIPTKNLLGFPVTALSFEEQIFLILKWARARASKIVCLANVHMLMEAYWNQAFASVLNSVDLVAPDGMPLVWMLKQMGVYSQDRVAGLDLFLRLCELGQLSQTSIFFLGSHEVVLERMRRRLKHEFPKLKIAGMEPLPFRPLTPTEDNEIVQKINGSGAGLLFVCLGCPKQEYWMLQHQHKIQAVMIGVGAVFPLYAGLYKRAPLYVRQSGLEWLYRLIQEPHRLFYRYSQTIPPFIWLAFQQLLACRQQKFLQEPISSLQTFSSSSSSSNGLDFLDLDSEPSKIGEILVRQNLISESSLLDALEKQRLTHKKLGEVLIELNYISDLEFKYYLKNQQMKLGELMVYHKVFSDKSLNRLLELQKMTKKRLGEIILQQRILSGEQIQKFLLEQYWRKKGLWLMTEEVYSISH
jgi:N-acetylglucosaminyldiphosphoundecaprenol N-acetyl-beta-D-mannosaminyltransferase